MHFVDNLDLLNAFVLYSTCFQVFHASFRPVLDHWCIFLLHPDWFLGQRRIPLEQRSWDLFLGGSCCKSRWRDDIAIPILRLDIWFIIVKNWIETLFLHIFCKNLISFDLALN